MSSFTCLNCQTPFSIPGTRGQSFCSRKCYWTWVRLDPITGLKRCSSCKEIKPSDAFWRSTPRIDGLQTSCKECKGSWVRKNRIRYMILSCQNRAKKEGVSCTITESDIYIPDYCSVSKCHRFLEQQKGRASANSPSIDKYDPKLGYIPENIWIICQECNRSKQNMSGEKHVSFGLNLISGFKEYHERLAQFQTTR